MSLRGSGPIDELAVPSGTTVEEHDVVTDGDVLVGGQSTVEFGLRGRNVAVGERVDVEDDIEADGDCRLDTWCTVDGNVLVGEDAYLGERVTLTGQLMVSGDLDIGDDVTIEEGFEANGWIVIRNPVPALVFYFVVLSQLLRSGETDAADELAAALADGDDVRDPLLIPRGAEVSDDAWRVSTPATVGDDCRIHGNLRAESILVGDDTEMFGSLRAREDVTVGTDTTIHGDVTTRGGTVTVEPGAWVRGDVSGGDLVIHDGAEVDGSLRARGEMKLIQSADDLDDDRTAVNGSDSTGTDPAATDSTANDDRTAAETDTGTTAETDADSETEVDPETNADTETDADPAVDDNTAPEGKTNAMAVDEAGEDGSGPAKRSARTDADTVAGAAGTEDAASIGEDAASIGDDAASIGDDADTDDADTDDAGTDDVDTDDDGETGDDGAVDVGEAGDADVSDDDATETAVELIEDAETHSTEIDAVETDSGGDVPNGTG